MPDIFDQEKRSWIMARVRGKDTGPEITVRSIVHRMGYRFRLHEKKLPGHPDIVLPRHKKVIFVHGCFWHGHEGCNRAALPSTNTEFWTQKICRTRERDVRNLEELEALGWGTLVVWQCEIRKEAELRNRLNEFLKKGASNAIAAR